MSIVSSPTTVTPASSSQQISNPNNTISQTGFLQILIAQLKNQDPSNPLSSDQFITENTQFAQLQQLMNMNTALGKLSNQNQNNAYATSLIGKNITTNSATVTVNGTSISKAAYSLPQNAADVQATIVDSNGNTIVTQDLGPQNAGTNTFQWNGRGTNGNYIANGTYTVEFSATDSNGNSMPVSQSAGTVTGVQFSPGGTTLTTNLGTTINLNNVTGVSS
ncbi:MAG: flagellar hook assembly protein FlgD [Candidatus Bathyarchaeales archaeon]